MSAANADRLLKLAHELGAIAAELRDMVSLAPRSPSPPPPPPPPSPTANSDSGPRAPGFGRNAGALLSQLEEGDLAWYESALLRSIEDPSKTKWREKNEGDLANVRAEIARRA